MSQWCSFRLPLVQISGEICFQREKLLTIAYQKYPNIPSHVPGTNIRCKRVIDARLRAVKKLPVVESSRRIIWDASRCCPFNTYVQVVRNHLVFPRTPPNKCHPGIICSNDEPQALSLPSSPG